MCYVCSASIKPWGLGIHIYMFVDVSIPKEITFIIVHVIENGAFLACNFFKSLKLTSVCKNLAHMSLLMHLKLQINKDTHNMHIQHCP